MLYRGRSARGVVASILLVGAAAGCNVITGANGLVVADNGGASAGGSSATGGQAATTGTGGKTTSSTSSTTSATSSSTTSATSSSTSSSSGTTTDPAQLCVDTINKFRATRNLPPYTRWSSVEACVSMEATTDGTQMSPHYAFINGMTCGASAQNECPNWAKNPLDPNQGIAACLAMMWAEKDQPGCSGCDGCDFPYSGCTNCTAEGTTVCGHYLDMKSSYLTKVACGFWSGGWYTQDFAK